MPSGDREADSSGSPQGSEALHVQASRAVPRPWVAVGRIQGYKAASLACEAQLLSTLTSMPGDLRPHDRFTPGGRACAWLDEMGLVAAWQNQATPWPTVAEQLADLPTGTLEISSSAGTLAQAENYARQLSEAQSLGDVSTATRITARHLASVLLRGTSQELAGGEFRFTFDTGESRVLPVPHYPSGEWFALAAISDPVTGEARVQITVADTWNEDDTLTLPRFHANPAVCLNQCQVNRGLLDGHLDEIPFPPLAPAEWGLFNNWISELLDARPVRGGQERYALDGIPVRTWWPEHLRTLAGPAESTKTAMPAPRLVKTAAQAEAYAAEVLRALGFDDARPTPPGADGGIDVLGARVLAQVKMEGVPTGRPVVQALHGNAVLEARLGVLFSLAGYTTQALAWAERAGIPCFEFAFNGSIEPRTSHAEALVRG